MAKARTEAEIFFKKEPYISAAAAITAGDTRTLERLITGGLDVNFEGPETKTPWGIDSVTLLLWAELHENIPAMEVLLKAGANANKGSRRGLTPLIDAALKQRTDIFELFLLKYKADPNVVFYNGIKETALTAVLKELPLADERWRRAEMLFQHGANVNLDLDRGETAVISVSILDHRRAVLWLLEHGANHEVRGRIATMMCYLRDTYQTNTLQPSEEYAYRDNVRDWLLAHGVARSRVDPALHPGHECDD
jgi:hypothetical protein